MPLKTEAARLESEIARRRNRSMVRVTMVSNGYVITMGDTRDEVVATSDTEMIEIVTDFFKRQREEQEGR